MIPSSRRGVGDDDTRDPPPSGERPLRVIKRRRTIVTLRPAIAARMTESLFRRLIRARCANLVVFLARSPPPLSRFLCAALPPGAQPAGRGDVGRRAAHGLRQGAYLCRWHRRRCRLARHEGRSRHPRKTAPKSPPMMISNATEHSRSPHVGAAPDGGRLLCGKGSWAISFR